ncbi:MAG: LysE family translocator [Streptosporangiales bacterium]|nr:LysE family translocator [Streptosporangiales bacterium]
MSWSVYATFCAFAIVVIVAPGPDFAVVVRNAVSAGRTGGAFAGLGVLSASFVQATAAAFGVGALIARSQPLFEALRWIGVAYLGFLGFQALRAALRRDRAAGTGLGRQVAGARSFASWRQGFLSNITNPKVLALYLSVLPQFLRPGDPSPLAAMALSYTFVLLSVVWLALVVWFLGRVRRWLARARVRRAIDAVTGTVLVGFAVRLAAESR